MSHTALTSFLFHFPFQIVQAYEIVVAPCKARRFSIQLNPGKLNVLFMCVLETGRFLPWPAFIFHVLTAFLIMARAPICPNALSKHHQAICLYR